MNSKTKKKIVSVVIGDTDDALFGYKNEQDILEIFSDYFEFSMDESFKGTRPEIFMQYMATLATENQIENFFSIILSDTYLMITEEITAEEVAKRIREMTDIFNEILLPEKLEIILVNGKVKLQTIHANWEKIGEGGFATTYFDPVKKIAVKQLLPSMRWDGKNISRFKREFALMRDHQDNTNVLPVYNYIADEFSFEMLHCKYTLKSYLENFSFDVEQKRQVVRLVLTAFTALHSDEIIHRDISPTNILIDDKLVYISDFGLSKETDRDYSYKTQVSAGYGTGAFAAPELMSDLSDGSMRSDVYSLGKIINLIMTGDERNIDHELMGLVGKATAQNPSNRFISAKEMLSAFDKALERLTVIGLGEKMLKKLDASGLDSEICGYFDSLNDDKLIDVFLSKEQYFLPYVGFNTDRALSLETTMFENFDDWNKYSYTQLDRIASWMANIIPDVKFKYEVREKAAEILWSIAVEKAQWDAQGLIEKIRANGVEPALEDILEIK